MIRGKTHNAEESLHNVIWSRCPKTIFMGKHKLHGAVSTAISSFNEGAIHMSQVLKKLVMEPNQLMNIFIDVIDSIRLPKSVYHPQNLKKEQDGLKNDKHTIMQQKVLLILKHIKLEDSDMWFCGS